MEDKLLKSYNGYIVLFLTIIGYILAFISFIFSIIHFNIFVLVISILYLTTAWILFMGLHSLKPNQALVFTCFGSYVGTRKEEGFFFINPFARGYNPSRKTNMEDQTKSKKLSLKVCSYCINKLVVNDCENTPLEIEIQVLWQIKDCAKTIFNVENYRTYFMQSCIVSIQEIIMHSSYPNIDVVKIKDHLQNILNITGIEVLSVSILSIKKTL
ncbi:SPFH domain-containing protein [Floccifex sp.]|uniref:SPFH domain-containing protein n=1 Tax=Floccifex sp. TaxID=2815810 RepID=UPI002A756398|nr:SPFH domain-containing protein [Floccifex sp.]MDY2957891.1 SPFH domain-containing protein [Floccifex sp.]